MNLMSFTILLGSNVQIQTLNNNKMKKQLFVALLLIASAAIWMGCNKEDDPQYKKDYGSIIGTITDFATGEPVRNANVQLRPTGETTLTGSDGMYEFKNLPDGEYSITVSKADYSDLIDDYVIIVEKGKTMRRDVQINQIVSSCIFLDELGNEIEMLDFGTGSGNRVSSRTISIKNTGSEKLYLKYYSSEYPYEWIYDIDYSSLGFVAGKTINVTFKIDDAKLSPGQNTLNVLLVESIGKSLLVKAQGCPALPNVEMVSVNGVSAYSAAAVGRIINDYGFPIYWKGFVIGTAPYPTIDLGGSNVYEGNGVNDFTGTLSGYAISSNTHYYARAFAENARGIAYSNNQIEFTTTSSE